MSFNLQQLTEGIRQRHVGTQNKRLVEKWNRTGLLRGLDDVSRENMSTLLENQAAQVLREANTLGGDGAGSDVRGFANIAFPIVRRVFGGLVANELVSIQPMSLPSGLLFYLDYTYGSDVGAIDDGEGTYKAGQSIYNSPVGKGVQSGSLGTGGQYDLVGSGFSRNHVAATNSSAAAILLDKDFAGGNDATSHEVLAAGGFAGAATFDATTGAQRLSTSDANDLKMLQFDPQIIDRIDSSGEYYAALVIDLLASNGSTLWGTDADLTAVKDIAIHGVTAGDNGGQLSRLPAAVQSGDSFNVRRLNQLGTYDAASDKFTANPFVKPGDANACLLMIVKCDAAAVDLDGTLGSGANSLRLSYVKADSFEASATGGDTLTVPSFESDFGSSPTPVIPEIDIKIESIPVTAQTRKLRARWSPELAQDLNAYHSMDAEVELTQILSEQIALEIDREILNDLLTQAQGANYYWSRSPGKFVNKASGAEIARTSTLTPGPAFTGTVREWYETLTETVIDVANEIHRKTLRGSANFIVVSPDVATILEASVLYRPAYSLDGDGQVGAPFTMGAEKIGTLSNRFTVYKDPYFPRNKILVGYKGGSYLETGFVYAPYVPLIVTPTIFAPEDFTPRKGVMTRYGKKMVRADFYGTVTCLDMNVI